MGQKQGKQSNKKPMPEALLETYIQSEFKAMDSDHDNVLSRQQVLDLLVLLGYSKGKEKLKALHVKSEDSVTFEDYVKVFKADKVLIKNTNRFRELFCAFDKDEDGTVLKEEMVGGLESLDIEVDKALKTTIEQMDTNNDGKISYEEFLTMEFKIALTDKIKSSPKKEEETK